MSDAPQIDKIIGSSCLTRNTLTIDYKSGTCVFACQGFFSVVLPKEQRRYDLQVCDDCREITAIAFSNTGEHLVIGEMGPNARFFIVTLSSKFDEIVSKTEVRTKENGFSCISMDSEKNRLITVGNDAQPFFLLWDVSQPKPVCIGCYHLAVTPSYIQTASDGSFAFVSGEKMLKFIDIGIQADSSPVVLKTKNANIGQFKESNFVSVAISVEPPYTAYALTNDGILCVFESSSIPFGQKRRSQSSIVTVPIRLNCGTTSSLVMDRKIILCGTATGAVLAIKKERGQHRVFGQFASEGKAVIGIGISERMTVAAYDDGSLIFWQRRINSPPMLTMPSHRGPVCNLFVCQEGVLSCGSDGTVRSWKLQKQQELIGKSSQEQICQAAIAKKSSDYLTNLTGVRCVACCNKLVFAGDSSGNLHILKLDKLEEIKKIIENFPGIMCIAVHKTEPYVATGGGDGSIRIYTINGTNLSLKLTKQCHNSPVTSLVFVEQGLISSSSNGIRFCSISTGEIYASYGTDEALLSLATIPSEKMVVAGGYDGYVSLFKVSDGSLFRRYKLSQSSYPISIAVDKCGLFIAAAMSDGVVSMVDLFSGDVIFNFQSLAGIITSLHFHEGDLILSSYSGLIMRWTMPNIIHTCIAEKSSENQPILDILLNSEDKADMQYQTQASRVPAGSLMKGVKPEAGWLFKEAHSDPLQSGKPLAQEGNEEEDEVEQGGFDAPRPWIPGAYESKVDDVVRASFMRKKSQDEANAPQNVAITEELSVPPSNRKSESLRPRKAMRKIDVDEVDPFTVNDKAPPSPSPRASVDKSRGDEMRAAAKALLTAFENAKQLLTEKPSCPDEIAAQKVLREALDSVKGEAAQVNAVVHGQIKNYAEKILFAVQQLK